MPTGRLSFDSEVMLTGRGLCPEACHRAGVVTAQSPDGGDEWVAIPYRKGGVTVGHKYRRVLKAENAPNFSQDKGTPQIWWNYDCLTDPSLADQPLIITEGEFDALAAMSAGYSRVVSVPGGAPQAPTSSEGKYAFIADTLSLLSGCREVILACDTDGPGKALTQDLAIRIGRGRCKLPTYPDGCKDLLDVLVGYGVSAVVSSVQNARWMHVPGLYRMSELPPVPEAVPHYTGIAGMGDHYRIRKGDFTVVTGIPGCGKSTFVNDLCCRMAHKHGWSTVFASFEQHPQIDHRRALRKWITRKAEENCSDEDLHRADDWIDQHFSFVIGDEDEDATLDWLLDKLASAVIRYGADIAVIDPWNEMDHQRVAHQTTTEYTGQAIRALKKFARKWNVHLIVVAHPAKMFRDKDGKVPVPTLYDIADSAHWFNKPDLGIVIHGEHDERLGDHTAVYIKKSRYHEIIGKPGVVRLRYIASIARFEAPV